MADECRVDRGFDGSQYGLTEGINLIDMKGVNETKILIRQESSSPSAQIHQQRHIEEISTGFIKKLRHQ